MFFVGSEIKGRGSWVRIRKESNERRKSIFLRGVRYYNNVRDFCVGHLQLRCHYLKNDCKIVGRKSLNTIHGVVFTTLNFLTNEPNKLERCSKLFREGFLRTITLAFCAHL